jgi:putative peptide zinc metalloprotease protein
MQMQLEQATLPTNPKIKLGIQFFQMDGGLYHVFDPTTSKHFRMGQQEVQWLKLLDGERSKEALRDQIPQEYFDQFFSNTTRLGLLDGMGQGRTFDLLKIKVPLSNPNRLLDEMGLLTKLYRVLLNRLSVFLAVLNIMGLLMLGRKAIDSLASLHFSPWIVVFYLVAILLIGFCHEASHSIVAKSYGVNVPAVGMMLFYLHPSFYADVSGIRLIRSQAAKINVLCAGVMANNLLVSLSLFLYFLLPEPARTYASCFVWMNVMIVFINLIPFVEYDGYYILQELLNEPDLASRARQSVMRGVARSRFDYVAYFLLSQAFAVAMITSAFVGVRRYALHFTHSSYVNYGCAVLMIAALAAFAVRTVRKAVKP